MPTRIEEEMNNRLYVGNLSFDLSADALRQCFAECGEVSEAHIMTDRETGRARGFAFVTMKTDAEANNAVTRLNGAMLEGRAMRVNVAEERPRRDANTNGRGGHRGW